MLFIGIINFVDYIHFRVLLYKITILSHIHTHFDNTKYMFQI